ncbi:MAG: ATP-binding protein [Desulfomonile tiedjei]|nr:ATP-binding protein [Desulfomonile tiedjei]
MQDLSLHILDVAENGIIAGADSIRITVEEKRSADELTIEIEDNGRGMDPGLLERALDPFVTTRTTRKVGLGLSLFRQAAREAGGDLTIDSALGVGTKVRVIMSHGHIDRKPLGNLAETMVTLIEGNPDVDFFFRHRKDGKEYSLDTREIRSELEEVPLNSPEVIRLIRENLASGLQEVEAS